MDNQSPDQVAASRRETVTAVGDWDKFEANCTALAGLARDTELAIASVLAFAAYEFLRHDREDPARFKAIDRARSITGLHSGMATELQKALNAAKRLSIPEGKGARATALEFGNERAAAMFHYQTKAREEAAAKRRAGIVAKAEQDKKAADAALKAAREEGKREALEEAEAAGALEVPEFFLLGEGGDGVELTRDEYLKLLAELRIIRQSSGEKCEVIQLAAAS